MGGGLAVDRTDSEAGDAARTLTIFSCICQAAAIFAAGVTDGVLFIRCETAAAMLDRLLFFGGREAEAEVEESLFTELGAVVARGWA